MNPEERYRIAYDLAGRIRELAAQVQAAGSDSPPLGNQLVCEAHCELALAIEDLIKRIEAEMSGICKRI